MSSLSLEDQVEFEDNPEPRCPVVLVLDTSGSMQGDPINQLNDALVAFDNALKADALAALRVEVSIVTFGGTVEIADVGGTGTPFDASQAFVTADKLTPPTLIAGGGTPMGEAVRKALTLIRERKDIYKRNGLDYFRPWIFLISDGAPTDFGWESAADMTRQEEDRKGVIFYAVGTEGADLQNLARFSDDRQPLRLKGLAFRELFQWLSSSLSAVAKSRPGDQVPLPAVGWAAIDT